MSMLPTLRNILPVSQGLGYSRIEGGKARQYPLSAIGKKSLWITAGQYSYRIGYLAHYKEISFQRYDKVGGSPKGSEHRLRINILARDPFVVGREEGGYVLNGDPYLSRKHFSLSLSISRKSLVLVVGDMGSLNGTISPKMPSNKKGLTAQEKQKVRKGEKDLLDWLSYSAMASNITFMGFGQTAIPPCSIFVTPEGKLNKEYHIDNWPVVLQLEVDPKDRIIIKDVEFSQRYSVERKPCGKDGVLLDYARDIPGEIPEQLKALVQAMTEEYNKRILAAK